MSCCHRTQELLDPVTLNCCHCAQELLPCDPIDDVLVCVASDEEHQIHGQEQMPRHQQCQDKLHNTFVFACANVLSDCLTKWCGQQMTWHSTSKKASAPGLSSSGAAFISMFKGLPLLSQGPHCPLTSTTSLQGSPSHRSAPGHPCHL